MPLFQNALSQSSAILLILAWGIPISAYSAAAAPARYHHHDALSSTPAFAQGRVQTVRNHVAQAPRSQAKTSTARPRVFISTDMQMITGLNHIDGDKDDVQSLVHALMYQDKINIVGLASSTSRHQPGANDKKFIHHTIDVYALDQPKLARHSKPGDFKSAEELHAITYQGTKTVARAPRLVRPVARVVSWASRWGYPPRTPASNAIIKEARAAKRVGDPLYIVTWGGMGDVARALKDAPEIADTLRLISIAGPLQEPNAYKYVFENFAGQKGFWWIDVNETFRGMYASETAKLPPAVTISEIAKFAKGHGHLGDFFYANSKDLRGKGDTYGGLKMGDSPSILYLIDEVNNDDPTASSWGGAYRKVKANYWTDRTDAASSLKFHDGKGARTIYRHRAAWLGDFMTRFDWLVDEGSQPLVGSEEMNKPVPGRL